MVPLHLSGGGCLFFFFLNLNHGRCGPRHLAGMAADGAGRWAGYAANSTGTALHATSDVRQRGSLFWNVSSFGFLWECFPLSVAVYSV